MNPHAGGYVLVPEGRRTRPWESEPPTLRGMAVVVALTLALIGAFSALSHGSSNGAAQPSARYSHVGGRGLVQPPLPADRTIADPVPVDYSRTAGPGR